MSEDDELDRLLSEHYSRELDAQRGRAQAAFEAQRFAPRWSVLHVLGGATGLIAASIAVVIFMARPHDVTRRGQVVDAISPDSIDPTAPRELERLVLWRTVDDGAALVGDTMPVRKLSQEAVEQVRYYDPQDRATVQLIVPIRTDFLVECETY